MEVIYAIDLLVECTVADDLAQYDFPGIPLRKGCCPTFQFQDAHYFCKIKKDEGEIDISQTGRLELTLATERSTHICKHDKFQLVTESENELIILAEGKVIDQPRKKII